MQETFRHLNNVRKPKPIKPEDLIVHTVMSEVLSPTNNRYSYNRDKLPSMQYSPAQRELYDDLIMRLEGWLHKANMLKKS